MNSGQIRERRGRFSLTASLIIFIIVLPVVLFDVKQTVPKIFKNIPISINIEIFHLHKMQTSMKLDRARNHQGIQFKSPQLFRWNSNVDLGLKKLHLAHLRLLLYLGFLFRGTCSTMDFKHLGLVKNYRKIQIYVRMKIH